MPYRVVREWKSAIGTLKEDGGAEEKMDSRFRGNDGLRGSLPIDVGTFAGRTELGTQE